MSEYVSRGNELHTPQVAVFHQSLPYRFLGNVITHCFWHKYEIFLSGKPEMELISPLLLGTDLTSNVLQMFGMECWTQYLDTLTYMSFWLTLWPLTLDYLQLFVIFSDTTGQLIMCGMCWQVQILSNVYGTSLNATMVTVFQLDYR